MPRRGENIHKRKDGRWEARIKSDSDNSKYVSIYGKSYREAKEKKNEFIASRTNASVCDSAITVSDVIHQWKESNFIQQKDSTKLKYEFVINQHIIPELGEMPLVKMDKFTVTNFFKKKLQEGRLDQTGGLEPAYLKVMACILNSVMQFAAEKKYCDPVKVSFHVPGTAKKELAVMEKEDQIRLETEIIKECTLTGLGVLISLNAGLRIGEVCALRWEDINLNQRCISVRHTTSRIPCTGADGKGKTCLIIETPKTKTSLRDIPIPLKLISVFSEMKRTAVSEYVVSDKNTFISPRTYEYRFHRLLAMHNIPQINYHALRHTFATRCIEAGVDIKTLSEFMGHSNVSITLNTYVHSSMDLKREQIEKLSNILSNLTL